jgi:hypothetical protein
MAHLPKQISREMPRQGMCPEREFPRVLDAIDF